MVAERRKGRGGFPSSEYALQAKGEDGGGKATFSARACLREVLLERLAICGPVLGRQGCGMLLVSCGASFANLQSHGSKLCPVCIFHGWLERLPILLRHYSGKVLLSTCVDPKQLAPQRTCAQQMDSLVIGRERCFCLLSCSLFWDPKLLLDGPAVALAVVWLHGGWSAFGNV